MYWEFKFGAFLVFLSFVLYFIHYLVFRNLHHILLWGLTNLAFLPLSVLLVTLIINSLLVNREKMIKMEKLNMVIGAFFSDVGTELLAHLSDSDPNLEDIRGKLIVTDGWSVHEFMAVETVLRNYGYSVDIERIDLPELKKLLREKRDFLLRLLENPNLLEHERFTKSLRAVFHLSEELSNRKVLTALPESDLKHLQGDIKRAYSLLVGQWLDYMQYLKNNYPYLFSLAMRTNPFDQNASPIVKEPLKPA